MAKGRIGRGAIGVLVKDARLLLIRRAAGVTKPGTWCFPGGRVEAQETSRHAIQREILEELGIAVRPMERIGSIQVLDSGYILVVWRVEHVSGLLAPASNEISETRWMSAADVRALPDGLPSNARVLELLHL